MRSRSRKLAVALLLALLLAHVGILTYGCGYLTQYRARAGWELRLVADHLMLFRYPKNYVMDRGFIPER